MPKVIVIGGGWAGCAAAISARKAGAEVTLLERTDMLLGTGLVGGIMRNNGRFTATEEMIALGGGDLFELCDQNSRHVNIEFPGHQHASLYDVAKIHGAVLKHLSKLGVEVLFKHKIKNIEMEGHKIIGVKLPGRTLLEGDVFVDATGTAGPPSNCTKYGNGCVMCIIRCPSFGGRVSIAALAGVVELQGEKPDGSFGAMSGSCKIHKESLAKGLRDELDTKGVAIVPVPEDFIEDHLDIKACQQYAMDDYKRNLILLDTGHAKLMTPYFDTEALRRIPGFENVRFEDPYAGGVGNSIRFIGIAPRDPFLRVEGVQNLFCAGEKAGLLVGHTEAIVTGTLAGHNSVREATGVELLELPRTLAVGDAIAYVGQEMSKEEGRTKKYTFSGSVYFERMKKQGLYITDRDVIVKKVEDLGLSHVFASPIKEPSYSWV